MKPAYRDLLIATALGAVALIMPPRDPNYHDFWLFAPLTFGVPLAVAGLLELVPSRVTAAMAMFVHALMLLLCTLTMLLALFLLVTILFAGYFVVLAPVAAGLGANSIFALKQNWPRKTVAHAG